MTATGSTRPADTGTYVTLADFLVARLTEELEALWDRDARGTGADRPGLPAQVAVVDEMLVTLDSGRLPDRRDLRMLLFAYGTHPDYDPSWTRHLVGAG